MKFISKLLYILLIENNHLSIIISTKIFFNYILKIYIYIYVWIDSKKKRFWKRLFKHLFEQMVGAPFNIFESFQIFRFSDMKT